MIVYPKGEYIENVTFERIDWGKQTGLDDAFNTWYMVAHYDDNEGPEGPQWINPAKFDPVMTWNDCTYVVLLNESGTAWTIYDISQATDWHTGNN